MLKSIGEKANADTPLLECGKCYWLIPDSSLVPPFRKETGTSQKVPVYVPVMNSKDRFDFKSIGRPPVHSYLRAADLHGGSAQKKHGLSHGISPHCIMPRVTPQHQAPSWFAGSRHGAGQRIICGAAQPPEEKWSTVRRGTHSRG